MTSAISDERLKKFVGLSLSGTWQGWTHNGAEALLHVRVADLNGELKQALARRHWRRPPAANDDWPDSLDEAAWEADA